MYESFGARTDGGKASFRLFLPDNTIDPSQYGRGGSPRIQKIQVIGDFQSHLGQVDWEIATGPELERQAHPNGWLYIHESSQDLPEGFYQYKYFVTFENGTSRYCSDPCAKYGGSDEFENSGFVVGGNTTTVRPLVNRLALRDLSIYELMIDDFTALYRGSVAPMDAVAQRLDYLESLGVNAVEFMPWTTWPGGDFSWGYNPVQFFSVEYRYLNEPGNPADKLFKLKTLINMMHDRGMHVIMDGVFNHVQAGQNPNRGFPYFWLYQEPEDSPYIGAFEGGGFFEEFDYHNGCVEQFIRDVCLYWLNTYKLDGIRFDYTLGFFERGTRQLGITKLITDLKDAMDQAGEKNITYILEHLPDNRYQAIDDTNQICATACWFDPLMFWSFDHGSQGRVDGDALRVLNASLDFAHGKGPVTYIENHDHSTAVSKAGGAGRWFKTQASAIALFTAPGAPMIHNGQEFGEDYFLPESGNDRVVPRPLRWNERGPGSSDFAGQRLLGIYQRLIAIRKSSPALRSANFFPVLANHPDGYGVFPDRGLAVYHRYGTDDRGAFERVIVVVNFSDYDQFLDIPFSANGTWQDLLNDREANVTDFRLRNERVPSNWGMIFSRRD